MEEIEALSNRVGGDHDPKPPYLRLQWSKDGSRAAEVYCFCCSGCCGEQEATAAGDGRRQGCSKEKQVASSSFQGDPQRDKWEESPLSTVLLRSMIVRQKPSERPAPEDDTC